MKRQSKSTGKRAGNLRSPIVPPLDWLIVRGARQNNLKNIDVPFALGTFNVVTGVSGSGKSSLVNEILYNSLAKALHRAGTHPGKFDKIEGVEFLNKVIRVDQQPIGQTPTSNPATYTGMFDLIRELFAQLPEAKSRGYTLRRFSFNVPGGRCEKCEGAGQLKIEMHFLPDVWITCDSCNGKRYDAQTLEVRFRGYSIADVLEMTCREALELFQNIPSIRRVLQTLCDVGLDYITLGQSAPTLSGGESQRLKLATELSRPDTGRTLYLLDEPTTGLHFEDLRNLLNVLHKLVDLGNTVIVIEHNLDVVKNADWIVDLGPEAGADGGYVVFSGTPDELGKNEKGKGKKVKSYTAEALIPVLEAGPFEDRKAKRNEKNTKENYSRRSEVSGNESAPPSEKNGENQRSSSHSSADDLMPWKVLGEKWHYLDKGLIGGEKRLWDISLLKDLFRIINESYPSAEYSWGEKNNVPIGLPEGEHKEKTQFWVYTKQADALVLHIRVPKGKITLKAIKGIGSEPVIDGEPAPSPYDIVKLRLTKPDDLKAKGLKKLI